MVEYMYCLPRLTLSLWKNGTPCALRDLISYVAPPAPGLSYKTFFDKINIYQNMLSDSRLRMSFEVKKNVFDDFSKYKPTQSKYCRDCNGNLKHVLPAEE